MAAIIGVDLDVAEEIAAEAAGEDVCTAANDNAPGQIVLSGSASAITRAVEIAKERCQTKHRFAGECAIPLRTHGASCRCHV